MNPATQEDEEEKNEKSSKTRTEMQKCKNSVKYNII